MIRSAHHFLPTFRMPVSSLIESADQNLVVHVTDATRWLPQAAVRLGPDLVLVDSGLPCDTYNLVCRSRLTSGAAAPAVAEAIAFYAATGHPYSWWLTPGYTPPELPAVLADAGFVEAESSLAMHLDITSLTAEPWPAGLEIRRVRTANDLRAFAEISAANWNPPDPHVIRFHELAADRLMSPASALWLYLGVLDGTPAATAELAVGGGVVGLYNISTRESSRGRGVGSAMTRHPLVEARAAGYDTAILQASPDGARVYQRIGFQTFGQVTEFKRP